VTVAHVFVIPDKTREPLAPVKVIPPLVELEELLDELDEEVELDDEELDELELVDEILDDEELKLEELLLDEDAA
jgi:hypothetical protein